MTATRINDDREREGMIWGACFLVALHGVLASGKAEGDAVEVAEAHANNAAPLLINEILGRSEENA